MCESRPIAGGLWLGDSVIVVLAIDPGIRSPGAALFADRQLVAATRIKVPAAVHVRALGDRVMTVAKLINGWYQALCWSKGGGITHELVYEWPQIYRTSRSKGDPNALLKTLAVGVAASALVMADRNYTPNPDEWAGQTKKSTTGDPWESQRGQMIARRLTDAEKALVPRSHDALDAVGLGLWRVGRFEPIRVYPGASPG